jgi:hypothetical protein
VDSVRQAGAGGRPSFLSLHGNLSQGLGSVVVVGRGQTSQATEVDIAAVGGSLAGLRAVVEGWHLAVDGDEIAEALRLVDRLTAKVHADVAALDDAGLWEHDGATSLTAWLRHRGGMTRTQATTVAGTAKRLRSWPATAAAWEAGELTGGQVAAISANVGRDHVQRYATHETRLLSRLTPLTVADTARAMSTWRTLADDEDGPAPGEPVEPRRHLHLSPLLDGRHRLDGELDAEGATIVTHALTWATTPGAPGDAERSPAAARGEALVEICRRALVGQTPRPGRRQRPHINVTVDVIALGLAGITETGPGRLDDGTALDQAATRRLLCDADIHRHITAGRSVILDHGTATRTITPGLFQALVLRDGGCRWPGCDRPHAWCEAHHVIHWLASGPTNPANLVLLCSRHHHLAHGQHGHRAGWHLALSTDATLTVTSPEGQIHRSRPPP